ncbi:unnamed protein product, partial [Choristocarpus tenellus]
FDLIIGADCLFFKEFHIDLLATIAALLSPSGRETTATTETEARLPVHEVAACLEDGKGISTPLTGGCGPQQRVVEVRGVISNGKASNDLWVAVAGGPGSGKSTLA